MRSGISLTVTSSDRRRLEGVVRDRNAAQKHAWRAEIVLLGTDGIGTNEIMRRTGKSETCVWRWQERFMEEGFEGLLRDKTRPSRVAPPGNEVAERIVISAEAYCRLEGERGGDALITAMQASPYREIEIAPKRAPMRVSGGARVGTMSADNN